jgi:hypothetical protein
MRAGISRRTGTRGKRCKNKGISRLSYQTHYVVNGGKARVILDVLVTPAEVTENLPMLDLLFRSRFRWRLRPHSVTGDAAYGTVENVAVVEKSRTPMPARAPSCSWFPRRPTCSVTRVDSDR